jgi:hypothetical protein
VGNSSWGLIIVVVGAFAIGYWLVGLIIKKVSQNNASGTPDQSWWRKYEQNSAPRRNSPFGNVEKDRSIGGEWMESSEEQKYARVLGLTGTITVPEIRRGFHVMVSKYHPDKVSHLGAEFQVIAEAKTREIVEAYDYFRKKYHFN